MTTPDKISPCLWFERQAEEAAEFYCSIFPDSRIDHLMRSSVDTSGAKEGEVILVEFTIAGQSYQALNGGRQDQFNDAVSLSVRCQDQAEVDRYWKALTADGGEPVACGWLRDNYGLRWQIVPDALIKLMQDPDRAKAKRVMKAMMDMVKIDVARLQEAYDQAA
jgi:predicted 3-demethylubiquinone-9 3-methyltransferase (glyoxalase superfamily)